MGIFQRLFGSRKKVELEELKTALEEVERDRRRNRVEVRRWERKRKQTLDRMKKARADGNNLEVDYLWDEFKSQRRSGVDIRRQGRTYNVEGTALKRYIRALEHLERKNDREGASRLFERIQASGLNERLSLDREDEIRYLEEMNQILDEFDNLDDGEREDPEKALFLAELDSIRRAEEEGDSEDLVSREEDLLERFGQEPEEDL